MSFPTIVVDYHRPGVDKWRTIQKLFSTKSAAVRKANELLADGNYVRVYDIDTDVTLYDKQPS